MLIKIHTKSICRFLMFVLIALPLAACGPTQEQIAAQTSTVLAAAAASWTSTPTISPVPTHTATPTATRTPTATPRPTQTHTPTATPDQSTSFSLQGVSFSLVPPKDWTVSEEADRVVFLGPTIEGTQLTLSIRLDQYDFLGKPLAADDLGISMYSAFLQDDIVAQTGNVVQISEDFLSTDAGKPYFRWVMEHNANGKELHQVVYIAGSGNWFLIATYTRPKSSGAEYDEIIEAAFETLRFAQAP